MSAAVAGAVIFDLDGVIIDSEGLQHRAYNQVLQRFGVQVDAAVYSREWIAAGRGPEYAIHTYRLPLSVDELRRFKDPVYHDLMRREVELVPGARAALGRLGAVFRLALATNSNATDTAFILDHFGLRGVFSAIVTREHYQQAKPAPDAFRTAAAQLGLAAQRCVVVEDAFKGIAAATAAGCACVAYPHGYTANNDVRLAGAVIGSLDELTVELVCALLARP